MRKIKYMLQASARLRVFFAFGIVLATVNIILSAASYYYLTRVFQGTTGIMARYGTDVVTYIVVGLALTSMLNQSLTCFYRGLVSAYFSRRLETILMSPTSVYTMLLSDMIGALLCEVLSVAIYILVGLTVFGISIHTQGLAAAAFIIMIGIIGTVGLGMFVCQVFFHTATGKGGTSSVVVFVSTFAGIFSGATFPIEVLPDYLRYMSLCLPQTHAIRAIRLVLSGQGFLNTTVIGDIIFLLAFSLLTIPLGTLLTNYGLQCIRRDGYSPDPGTVIVIR